MKSNRNDAVTLIEPGQIEVIDRLRPTSAATVEALKFVIAEFGFTVPILVRKMRQGYRLIDGAHRLAAFSQRYVAPIPSIVIECTDEEARVLEGSQNLAGAAMSPLDDAIFIAAFGEAYQKLHPETKPGLAGALARQGLASELNSFADVIAEKRSISKRQIQKIAAAGRVISREDADKLRGAKRRITLQDIQDLAKLTHANQREFVIGALVEGKKAGVALRAWRDRDAGLQPTLKDPVEEAYLALLKLWGRTPLAAKRRFVHQVDAELAVMEGHGE